MLTIVQARMTSSRLPGKVMRPILGAPMIGRQIERLRRSQRLGQLVVATSVDPSDDVIVDYCAELGCAAHRGPLHDVLGRFAETLEAFGPAEHIVRLTADCPFADWTVIDRCIALHLDTSADYTSNTLDRSYPRGLDVEVFRADWLPRIAAETSDPYDREHVTPVFYRSGARFKIAQLVETTYRAHLRWTVDRLDDFEFTTRVYETLYPQTPAFLTEDILALGWTIRSDPDDPLQPA